MKFQFTPTEGPLAGILMDKFAQPNKSTNPRSKEGFDPESMVGKEMVFATYKDRKKIAGRYRIEKEGEGFKAVHISSSDDVFPEPVVPVVEVETEQTQLTPDGYVPSADQG